MHQGSGGPRSARTDDNADPVNEFILSQEGSPKSTEPQGKFNKRQEFITLRYTV